MTRTRTNQKHAAERHDDGRRCGAKTRSGAPCRSFPVFRKTRCRMHGGAPGSGAPRGNRNALRHGLTTRAAKADRRALNRLMTDAAKLLRQMEGRKFRTPGR